MIDISLKDFLAPENVTQSYAAAIMGKTQGGIGYMLGGIESGKRDVRLVFNDQGILVRCYSIREIPIPAQQQQVA